MKQVFKRVWRFLRRTNQQPMPVPERWPLDQPLLQLTQSDHLTLRDFCEGVFALGNPGSGKSSTAGTVIPMMALRHGWGVVAYTSKPDDIDFWRAACERTGRLPHLRIIRPDGQTHFNLMRYELTRPTEGGGNTLKLAALMTEMLREGHPPSVPTSNSEYFDRQGLILLCNTIDCLRLAGEPLSFDAIGDFIDTAPMEPEALLSDHFQEGYCFDILHRAEQNANTPELFRRYKRLSRYWIERVPYMNSRTRADITSTVEGSLFELSREPFCQLLDSPRGCSFVPEEVAEGAVFVVDCPESVHGQVGRILTIAYKRLMKEMFRRRVASNEATRPILNFADECQCILTRDDASFQQVCRSNRISSVFLTQSIDNVEAVLGNDAHTNSLANALTTHLYFCTSGKTADWIERRIAQNWSETENLTLPSHSAETHTQRSSSLNIGRTLYPQVLASELARQRTGGPINGKLVDAVCLKPGRLFRASGAPFVRVQFQQT